MSTVRRTLMLVGIVAATGLLMSPVAYAEPSASPSPSPSISPSAPAPESPTPSRTRAPEPCAGDEWTVYTPINPVGMAYAPNSYAEDSARVTNKTSVDFPDVVFIFGVTPGPNAPSGPVPLVRFRVNGGPWHQFHLHKLNLGANRPYWGTDNVDLPELRPKASYTVTIGMAFPPGTPGRIFDTQFLLGTVECGPANLGEDYSMSYGYYPMSTPKSPARSGGGGSTKTGPNTTGAPTATPTAAPASTPATEPAVVPSTTDDALSVTPAPSRSPQAARPSRSSGAGWLIGAAILALGAICGLAFRRVRRG